MIFHFVVSWWVLWGFFICKNKSYLLLKAPKSFLEHPPPPFFVISSMVLPEPTEKRTTPPAAKHLHPHHLTKLHSCYYRPLTLSFEINTLDAFVHARAAAVVVGWGGGGVGIFKAKHPIMEHPTTTSTTRLSLSLALCLSCSVSLAVFRLKRTDTFVCSQLSVRNRAEGPRHARSSRCFQDFAGQRPH